VVMVFEFDTLDKSDYYIVEVFDTEEELKLYMELV